ncbi:PA-phosphatase [Sphingobacteriales bacterium UPWRP_1]|nr:PA-phosphatase [Sphingobacteriales bacterium UPWRP_1]
MKAGRPLTSAVLQNWVNQLPPKNQLPWAGIASGLYWGWFGLVVGLRTEHAGMYFFLLFLYFAHIQTRQFLFAFAIFLVYAIIYDSLRAFPNYLWATVHTQDLYHADKALFGIYSGAQKLSLNEYALLHGNPVFDVLSGLFYINWVPVPLLFAFYLFLYYKPLCLHFLYAFVFANLIGIVIYYVYPAAPPWYVVQHGFDVLPNTQTNAAGLLNFDAITGIPVFASIYSKGPVPFAAMPSMHAAFPVLCYLYGRQLQKRWLNTAFLVFIAGMWFSAVYSRHHYALDVLAGGLVAITAYGVFEQLAKTKPMQVWFGKLLSLIGG